MFKLTLFVCMLVAANAGYLQSGPLVNTGHSTTNRRQDGHSFLSEYNIQAADGGSSHHEAGDAYGNRRGSYTLHTADGRSRRVNYYTDAWGFHANVNTNEPGTQASVTGNAVFNAPAKAYAANIISAPAARIVSHAAPAVIAAAPVAHVAAAPALNLNLGYGAGLGLAGHGLGLAHGPALLAHAAPAAHFSANIVHAAPAAKIVSAAPAALLHAAPVANIVSAAPAHYTSSVVHSAPAPIAAHAKIVSAAPAVNLAPALAHGPALAYGHASNW